MHTWNATATFTRPPVKADNGLHYTAPDNRSDEDVVNSAVAIISAVSGVDCRDILGTSRTQRTMNARHLLRYYLREYCQWTLKRIGKATHCDHTTVLCSVTRAQNLLDTHDAQWSKLAYSVLDKLLIPSKPEKHT